MFGDVERWQTASVSRRSGFLLFISLRQKFDSTIKADGGVGGGGSSSDNWDSGAAELCQPSGHEAEPDRRASFDPR